MRYVMVPVPSEYVLDVMRWLLFRAEDSSPEDDEPRLRKVVEDADDLTRSLLRRLAKATIEGVPVPLSEAADEFELDAPTLRATLRELDAQALGEGRVLVKVLHETAVNEHGRKGRVSYLTMRPHHARMLRSAVRGAGKRGG